MGGGLWSVTLQSPWCDTKLWPAVIAGSNITIAGRAGFIKMKSHMLGLVDSVEQDSRLKTKPAAIISFLENVKCPRGFKEIIAVPAPILLCPFIWTSPY